MTSALIEFDRRRQPGSTHDGEGPSAASDVPTCGNLGRGPLVIRHIVAPFDGSPLAECTLSFVSALARAFSARVTLLRVLEPANAATTVDTLEWELARAEAYAGMARLESALKQEGCNVTVEMVQGRPAEQVAHFASRENADLIVLSSHGAGGLHGWNLSSTVHKVVVTTHASVMVVPAQRFHGSAALGGVIRKILVPLDCSPRAECVLPAATELARLDGAQLVLAHVVPEPEMPRRMALSSEDQALAAELVRRNQCEAERYLRELQRRLSVTTENVGVRIVSSARVARALRDLALEERADLVLLCAHGSAGDPTQRHGGVAAKALQELDVPVLVLQDLADLVQARAAADMVGPERPGH